MIARVWGECDGIEIGFKQRDDGSWGAVVPKDMGGEYVVAVWAEDEAGNISYLAKLLFAVNPATLRVTVSTIDVSGAMQDTTQFLCAFQRVEATVSQFDALGC